MFMNVFVRRASFLLLLGASCGLPPVAAQDAKPKTVAEARALFPWTLVPATEPNPALSATLDSPADLVLGEFPLDTKRNGVVDGDTIRVDGVEGSLRLIGLDCEETFKDVGKLLQAVKHWDEYVKTETAGKSDSRPAKYATPMGMAAWNAAEAVLKDAGKLRIEYDEATRKLDGFGRHLTHVFVRREGAWLNLNVEIVRQGLSPYFVKYGRSKRYDARYEAAQVEARAAKRGIWGPTAPLKHYGDYDVRLAWWAEREIALRAAEAAHAKNPSEIFLLGQASEWARLKTAVGRRVTVVSTIDSFRERGALGLLGLAHMGRQSFMIAGDVKEIAAFNAPKVFEGDLVFATGVVELYKDEPQFKHAAATPVAISKSPPAAGASPPK